MFSELTKEENAEIQAARNAGYAQFFPCIPNAEAQAKNTLAGARAYLEEQKAG